MMLLGRSTLGSGAGSARCTAFSRARRRAATARVAGLAALLVYAPAKTASADITSDRVEFFYYGRMGISWNKSGMVAQGQYMNVVNSHAAIGGRLEEADYMQVGFRFHIRKPKTETDTAVDLVTDYEVFSTGNSGIVSDLGNGDINNLKIVPEQAYIQAKNVFTPGLEVWMGSRLYRKNDVHITDYFYFNRLNGQGVGAIYSNPKFGELDVAILEAGTGNSNFFRPDAGTPPLAPPPATPGVATWGTRARTMFVMQYKIPLGLNTSFIQGLGEFHGVPRSQIENEKAPKGVNPRDFGAVGGLKLHIDFGNESFNDTSIRYGNGIANGAEGGGATYQTFGLPDADGKYKGAYGIEAIEHFGINVKNVVGINGYAMAHYSRGATDLPASDQPRGPNIRADYAVGVRPTFFVRDDFHMIFEATHSMRRDDGNPKGTVTKIAVVPTIVPDGKRSMWARPHIRAIYVLGIYNQAAQTQRMSPFLVANGPTNLAHYVGFRTEWWF